VEQQMILVVLLAALGFVYLIFKFDDWISR